ncbi:PaaI family thioesterase [Oleispirillum naphthae]|uniref:PaaI family thioesterase n=1 Tax=Oleispirillum naphthae TaxID=2838853 RepID=UPI0030823045
MTELTTHIDPGSEDWPDFIKRHFGTVAFLRFMEVTVEETGPGTAVLSLPLRPEFANSYGIAHGGIAALFVDMAAGVALRTLKMTVVTVETTTTYLAPIPIEGVLRAEAQTLHQGRRILHAEVRLIAPDGVLAAVGRAIYTATGVDTGDYPARK